MINTPPSDETMELIAYLYDFMDDEEMESWSRQAAEEMVADQHRYEIDHDITPRVYDAEDFFEIIAEFIAQDENDDEF